MDVGGVLGPYRITGRLGHGGTSEVYAAEHTALGRPVAVKVLPPELARNPEIAARFFDEARAAAAIRHPGIVEILDSGWHTDGAAYLIMERLEGESLADRLERGPLPWRQALAIARQIADVLAATHAQGIVHRDLKPDNVFLAPDPEAPGGERVKLLDFGIAQLGGDAGGRHTARTGAMMGTPSYMAPERCRGAAADHRADLYALGCILFKLCTGRAPFVGEDAGEIFAAHLHLPVPAMASLHPGIPVEVEHLVQRLLAKRPQDRPQTADELAGEIDRVIDRVIDAPSSRGGYSQ